MSRSARVEALALRHGLVSARTVDAPAAFPYRVAAHYYRRGPMGVGLGSVQVIRHDGAGNVTVEDRPFAIQNDGAMIELGAIAR